MRYAPLGSALGRPWAAQVRSEASEAVVCRCGEGAVMHCPFCRHPDSRVVDSRETDEGQAIRRRRSCPECGRRFTTVETAVLAVVKRSGVTEPFSREKVITGVRRACQGRQVDDDALNLLAQQVEDAVRAAGSPEVASQKSAWRSWAPARARRGGLSAVRLGVPVVLVRRGLRARDRGAARAPRRFGPGGSPLSRSDAPRRRPLARQLAPSLPDSTWSG